MRLFLLPFIIFLLITSCTKYRDVTSKSAVFTPPPDGTITWGSLRINEFVCKGSDPNSVTLLGCNAKWFELYNPTSQDITLAAGQWYVTDTLGEKIKCAITQNTIAAQWKVPAHGYLIITCPKVGSTIPSPTRFNANFSLSSSKGSIGIFYQASGSSPLIAIDTLNYNFGTSGALSGISYGRKPDGQDPANLQLSTVTPEATNN